MSRCYPYEKKAQRDQPPLELAADAQVTHKEKHKHKDKDRDKKKKRKREEKDDNAHKEKRSSKNHKAAHVSNDVAVVHPGENGRLAEPSAPAADNGQRGATKASAPGRESRPHRDTERQPETSGMQPAEKDTGGKTGWPHRDTERQPEASGMQPAERDTGKTGWQEGTGRTGLQEGRVSPARFNETRITLPNWEGRVSSVDREAGKVVPRNTPGRPPSSGSQASVGSLRSSLPKDAKVHKISFPSLKKELKEREVKEELKEKEVKEKELKEKDVKEKEVKAAEGSKPVGKEVKPLRFFSKPDVPVLDSARRLQEVSSVRSMSPDLRKASIDKAVKERVEKSGSVASTSKYVILDKEQNGKVITLKSRREQDPPQQHQQQQQQQEQKLRQQPQEEQLQLPQPQAEAQPQPQPQQQQQQQQAKEAHQKAEGGGGGGTEKREKRSRLAELKLADVPKDVNNSYEDDYLEWLFPNKRRPEATGESARAESSRDKEKVQEVWAEAVYLPSVEVMALPYVVPY